MKNNSKNCLHIQVYNLSAQDKWHRHNNRYLPLCTCRFKVPPAIEIFRDKIICITGFEDERSNLHGGRRRASKSEEILNTRVNSKEDITKITNVPIVGEISDNDEMDNLVVAKTG
ncbi:hypothetical protein DJ568_09165 [Mucilaginibacter hurinus]|uniref:Uncharacterized protein n=1 Tax=Mucilaginibacter hurinus TaxID=2201324 RepID=A0A367GPY4_9SPHI|nr:hypothetical protein DJ568_09165 [Mucilaginibacter hurinus]